MLRLAADRGAEAFYLWHMVVVAVRMRPGGALPCRPRPEIFEGIFQGRVL